MSVQILQLYDCIPWCNGIRFADSYRACEWYKMQWPQKRIPLINYFPPWDRYLALSFTIQYNNCLWDGNAILLVSKTWVLLSAPIASSLLGCPLPWYGRVAEDNPVASPSAPKGGWPRYFPLQVLHHTLALWVDRLSRPVERMGVQNLPAVPVIALQ